MSLLKPLAVKLFSPALGFLKRNFGRKAMGKCANVVTDFIFNCSKETVIIMLFFNAVSILSSHIAQIGGLKKSKRENKDYLINQEKQELTLDLILTIIPPFILNNFLKKKLESGAIVTKEAKEKLVNVVAPIVGVSRDELYRTDHIRPAKETVASLASKTLNLVINKGKNLKPNTKNKLIDIDRKIKKKLPDMVTMMPTVSLEDIACDFDALVKEKKIGKDILAKFRNGSAYDDLCGQNNGLLLIVTIAYTILASNIIMPILKNKLSNRNYEKQLKAMGETRESIKRKKRYDYNNIPITKETNSNIFEVFSNSDNSTSQSKQKDIFNFEKIKEPDKKENPFNSFDTYSSISSQSTGLRI